MLKFNYNAAGIQSALIVDFSKVELFNYPSKYIFQKCISKIGGFTDRRNTIGIDEEFVD